MSGLLAQMMQNQEEMPVALIAVGVVRRTKWRPVHLGCSPMGSEDLRYIRSPGTLGSSGLRLCIGCGRQRLAVVMGDV